MSQNVTRFYILGTKLRLSFTFGFRSERLLQWHVCDMCHTCVWHVSPVCQTHILKCHTCSDVCVTCVTLVCDMWQIQILMCHTYSDMWETCVTLRCGMCHTFHKVTRVTLLTKVWPMSESKSQCVSLRLCLWHVSHLCQILILTYVTLLSQVSRRYIFYIRIFFIYNNLDISVHGIYYIHYLYRMYIKCTSCGHQLVIFLIWGGYGQ